jgi:hypothetical protein
MIQTWLVFQAVILSFGIQNFLASTPRRERAHVKKRQQGKPLLTGGAIVTFGKLKTAFFAARRKTSASDNAFSR